MAATPPIVAPPWQPRMSLALLRSMPQATRQPAPLTSKMPFSIQLAPLQLLSGGQDRHRRALKPQRYHRASSPCPTGDEGVRQRGGDHDPESRGGESVSLDYQCIGDGRDNQPGDPDPAEPE